MQNANVTAAVAVQKAVNTVSFKDIALPMTARGIPVIPLLPRKKKAFLPNWPDLATLDPNKIDEWHKDNPQYNCGAVATLDGLWFLDCDDPHLLELIEAETGQKIPRTLTVQSGKGLHKYFKHNGASQLLKNCQIKSADGKPLGDVKAHNGYVVAPGSIHPETGQLYKWIDEHEIIEAPEWLVQWITQQCAHQKENGLQQGYAKGKLTKGSRNNSLFTKACQLRSKMSESDALSEILNMNKHLCEPPLDETEVQTLVASAYSYESKGVIVQGPALTEFGNAERLVAAEGQNIRYCAQNKSWYVWDSNVWRKDESGYIYRLGKKTITALKDQAELLAGEEKTILTAFETKCESVGSLNAMVSLARFEPGVAIRLEDFDTDPMLFNCANVTVDLETGKPGSACREDFINKISPVMYDADAQCPTWLKFLATVTNGDTELSNYLQRCAGYSLTGSTKEHVAFLLYGSGANGKSTFFEALRYVLGEYSQAADFSTFLATNSQNVRNDLAKLTGSRFVTAVESDYGKRLDETLVKQMTAGDTVTARFLYSEHFEYKPQFKLWLGTNHKPAIRGQDEGVWRRIRLIPFTVSIPLEQQDKNLIDTLRLEASGILNWALQGSAEWRVKGLQDPKVVMDATKEYRQDQDVLGQFIDSKCLREGEASSSKLYEAYKDWAEHSGEFEMSHSRFSDALTERKFTKVRRSTGCFWKGISLIKADDMPTGDY